MERAAQSRQIEHVELGPVLVKGGVPKVSLLPSSRSCLSPRQRTFAKRCTQSGVTDSPTRIARNVALRWHVGDSIAASGKAG